MKGRTGSLMTSMLGWLGLMVTDGFYSAVSDLSTSTVRPKVVDCVDSIGYLFIYSHECIVQVQDLGSTVQEINRCGAVFAKNEGFEMSNFLIEALFTYRKHLDSTYSTRFSTDLLHAI